MSDDLRGKTPGSQAALREHAFPKGKSGNPTGMNGWRKAQARIAKFMKAIANPDTKSTDTRFDRLLLAAYTSALVPGPKGAIDRKLLIEQVAGKAKQQVELTGNNGGALRVVAVLPDNGHGPDDPEDPPDGEPGSSAP
jgi:hypothetical protein